MSLPVNFNFDPAAWRGIKPQSPLGGMRILQNPQHLAEHPDELQTTGRERHAIPTYNQRGSSCGGEASCNALETAWRMALGDDRVREVITHVLGEPCEWQFDGYETYMLAREMFYRDQDEDAGLYLHEAWQALIDKGVLPPGTEVAVVPDDWLAVNEAIKTMPVICGMAVNEDDMNPASVNGMVRENVGPQSWLSGHAMCCLNLVMQGANLYLQNQQSWGRAFGWYGLVLYSAQRVEQALVDNFHALKLPPGWEHHNGLLELIRRMPEPVRHFAIADDDDDGRAFIEPPTRPQELG